MTRRQRILTACVVFALALLLAVYGGGFSWKQALFGAVALFFAYVAGDLLSIAFTTPAFHRIQFRVNFWKLDKAIIELAMYSEEELSQAVDHIRDGMAGHGSISLTWLETDLWYMNTVNTFGKRPEMSISLPAFGEREHKLQGFKDTVELRMSQHAYELVLLSSELRYANDSKGVILCRIPYKFLWAFQAPGDVQKRWEKIQAAAAATPDLSYHSDPDILSYVYYETPYGALKWWDL